MYESRSGTRCGSRCKGPCWIRPCSDPGGPTAPSQFIPFDIVSFRAEDSYAELEQLYDWVTKTKGQKTIVIEADDLQANPGQDPGASPGVGPRHPSGSRIGFNGVDPDAYSIKLGLDVI